MLDNEGVNPRCICLHLRRAEAVRQEASHGWRYPHVTMWHVIIFWCSAGVLVGGCVLCHRPSTGVLAGVNVLKWLWPWKRLWSYTLTLEWLLTLKRAVHWCTTPDLQETIDLERGSTSAHYSWPSSNHWPWKGMQYCTEMLGALLTLEGAAILLTNLGERNPWPWSDHWPWVVVLHADLEVVILTLKGAMVLHADL